MIFIGPSANIFVYLLVSAFFVVCFYSKSEAKLPEGLPGYAVAAISQNYSREVSCYHVTRQKKVEDQEKLIIKPQFYQSELGIYTRFIRYDDPNLTIRTRRAPPII